MPVNYRYDSSNLVSAWYPTLPVPSGPGSVPLLVQGCGSVFIYADSNRIQYFCKHISCPDCEARNSTVLNLDGKFVFDFWLIL